MLKVIDAQCWHCKHEQEYFVPSDEAIEGIKLYCEDCKMETPHSIMLSAPSFVVEGGYDPRMK